MKFRCKTIRLNDRVVEYVLEDADGTSVVFNDNELKVLIKTGFVEVSDDLSCGIEKVVSSNSNLDDKTAKKLRGTLTDTYLYNSYILDFEKCGDLYDFGDLSSIFSNTKLSDFDFSELRGCFFRVMNADILNSNNRVFKLLQVIKDKKVNGYILVSQVDTLDKKNGYVLEKVDEYPKNVDNDVLNKLCDLYTFDYNKKFRDDEPVKGFKCGFSNATLVVDTARSLY